MIIYRKIWTQHYGPIPLDEDGRSYDIHHIDGDRSNNCIENLKALSLKDHFNTHYEQGDWVACSLIAKRMELTVEERSHLSKQSNKERLDKGIHNFQTTESNESRLARGVHPSQMPEAIEKIRQATLRQVAQGKNSFTDKVKQKERALKAAGVHHQKALEGKHVSQLLVSKGQHNFQSPNHTTKQQWKCEHCNKEGKNLTNYVRWHGDNCKSSPHFTQFLNLRNNK